MRRTFNVYGYRFSCTVNVGGTGEGGGKERSTRSLNAYKHMVFDTGAYCPTSLQTPEIAHGTNLPCKKV